MFYNLSDDLRLKIATESSERKNFGIFPSYCDTCKRIMIDIDQFFICWFIQRNKANRIPISRMTDVLKTGYDKRIKGNIPFETQSSIDTEYFLMGYNNLKRTHIF